MTESVNSVINALKSAGIRNVYSVFDGDPIRSKGEFMTLVGIKSFEAMSPVYSPTTIYVPFRAELEITASAPDHTSVAVLCEYFETKLRPVIDTIPELSSRPVSVVCRLDRNIRRLTLTAAVSTEGIRRIHREAEL